MAEDENEMIRVRLDLSTNSFPIITISRATFNRLRNRIDDDGFVNLAHDDAGVNLDELLDELDLEVNDVEEVQPTILRGLLYYKIADALQEARDRILKL